MTDREAIDNMAEPKKFCKHSDGLGYCDILSDNETRQYCVEGPCPHEELVEYVPVVRCKDCKHWERFAAGSDKGICTDGDCLMYEDDFCSYGVRRTDGE